MAISLVMGNGVGEWEKGRSKKTWLGASDSAGWSNALLFSPRPLRSNGYRRGWVEVSTFAKGTVESSLFSVGEMFKQSPSQQACEMQAIRWGTEHPHMQPG